MFSVSASPFNSPQAQLYGGWTEAQAGNNLWALHKYHTMAARFGPPDVKRASQRWLKQYAAGKRALNDDQKARLMAALKTGRSVLPRTRRPPMSAAVRGAIWDRFVNTTLNPNTVEEALEASRNIALLGRAPLLPWYVPARNTDLTWPVSDPPKAAIDAIAEQQIGDQNVYLNDRSYNDWMSANPLRGPRPAIQPMNLVQLL